MSNHKKDAQLNPTMTVKQVGDGVYAINGLPKRSKLLILPAGQITVDETPLATLSGADAQDIFEDIDNYISNINQQLQDDVMLLYSDQTASGEKTFVDDLRVASNLLPSGSSVDIGASGTEFDELWVNTIHADSILVEGSPGLRLGHNGTVGFMDSTEDNDLEFRRNGSPLFRLEPGLVFFNNDVAILNNLLVSGTTTQLNTEQLLVEDNLVTLNSNHTGAPVLDAGIEVERDTQPNALVVWDEFDNQWEVGVSGNTDKITVESELLAASGTLQADIDTRVLRAGDTMTGSLLASSPAVDLGSGANPFGVVYASTFRRDDGIVTLRGSTGAIIQGGASGLLFNPVSSTTLWRMNSSAFYPDTDGTLDIGLTSRALANIYSRNILSDTALGLGSANTVRWTINTSAHLYPDTNGSRTLGLSTNHLANVFTRSIQSDGAGQDLSLTAQDAVNMRPGESTTWAYQANGNVVPFSDGGYNVGSISNKVGTFYGSSLVSNQNMFAYTTNNASNVHLGISAIADYSEGAFLELAGNNNVGGVGDARLGAGAGRILFYTGEILGVNALRWAIDQNGALENINGTVNDTFLRVTAANGAQSVPVQQIETYRVADNAFDFLNCVTEVNTSPENLIRLVGNGNIRLDGSVGSPAADYAEYFEAEVALSLGETVVMSGTKIRKFNPETDDVIDIVGVVRTKQSGAFIGNLPMYWQEKYQKDVYGEYVLSASGTRQLNPDYDAELDYISREDRDEWHLVALLGQIAINKSAVKHPRWIKLKELNDDVELWLIR